MQSLICPICGKQGLKEMPGVTSLNKRLVIHANEYYLHLKVAGRDYLARTQENLNDELSLPSLEDSLVLN